MLQDPAKFIGVDPGIALMQLQGDSLNPGLSIAKAVFGDVSLNAAFISDKAGGLNVFWHVELSWCRRPWGILGAGAQLGV
jgi:hypothetical protein